MSRNLDCMNFFLSRFPPQNSGRYQIWVNNCRRGDRAPSKSSLVCSSHFTDDNFDRTGQTVRLKCVAVPTIFDLPCHLKVNYPQQNSNSTKWICNPSIARLFVISCLFQRIDCIIIVLNKIFCLKNG